MIAVQKSKGKGREERVRLSKLPGAWRIDSKHSDVETVGRDVYTFDAAAANRACEFFEFFLTHTKGEWDGKPFILAKWQRLVLRRLFGWMRRDGTRRYRTLFLFVPRKNGKSTFAAGVALYALLADKEPGAEVYSAASDRDQAALVFDQAKAMVENSEYLQSRCQVFKKSIAVPEKRSKYVVLSGEGERGKSGFNTHCAIIDELHEHPSRALYDILVTSMGARRQPLTIITTTAGYDRHSVCYEQYQYAKRVDRDGLVPEANRINDGSYLAVIFEAAEGADWNDEETWKAANPNIGISPKWDLIRSEYKRAKEIPGFENTFKRLYLNIWTEQASRWLPMDTWRKCVGPERGSGWLRSMAGCELYAACDLSSTADLTALVGVFPDRKLGVFEVMARFWLPRQQLEAKERADHVPYAAWVREGFLEITDSAAVDQTAVEKAIVEWHEMYDLKEVAIDGWQANRIMANMEDESVVIFKHGQGMASMTTPSKDLERAIIETTLRHGGHPILDWMAANVAIKTDPAGNIKPAKDKSMGRIDGIVSLVMALGRAMLRAPDNRLIYVKAGRGFLSV